ncbi:hypothetical protein KY320_02690, partial [Candidatus Woesearchaeota archaeon]|nr:hypothetical protein [Candidatus Woesearchaeota archaeon]
KIEEIKDVIVTLGEEQGVGNNIEVECVELHGVYNEILDSCNARIDEEELTEFNDQTMAYYECTLTVETANSMKGEYWVTIEAQDSSGQSATIDENEYWFLNPTIGVSIEGSLNFGEVRPGTIAYSDTIKVGNAAESGSGVLLDMFISATDFYDWEHSGARCVITNRLKLGDNYVSNLNNGPGGISANKCEMTEPTSTTFWSDTADHFCYYAVNGAYSTQSDPRSDAEGYAPIVYGASFTRDFYNDAELLEANRDGLGQYWHANILAPGSEMSVTFKMALPEPCVGDFNDGDIYFWVEPI